MKVILIYDISHDNTRNKIADLCLDYGLDRVQYSSFEGQLRRTHQEELMLKIKKKLGKRVGDVRLIPICEKDWTARLHLKNEEPARGTPSATPDRSEKKKRGGS
jgi:CRISPR-associated protein Cas2